MLFQGQILGKYKILSPLGSGGFGTVYLARDTWIDKQVAIKVPHRQNLDFGDLLREPRLLASVSHPNIVAITTAEKQDGVFFIVMEYVPGETLETIILREGALELSRALDYACQICNAVDHAHRSRQRHGVHVRAQQDVGRLADASEQVAGVRPGLRRRAPRRPTRL